MKTAVQKDYCFRQLNIKCWKCLHGIDVNQMSSISGLSLLQNRRDFMYTYSDCKSAGERESRVSLSCCEGQRSLSCVGTDVQLFCWASLLTSILPCDGMSHCKIQWHSCSCLYINLLNQSIEMQSNLIQHFDDYCYSRCFQNSVEVLSQ